MVIGFDASRAFVEGRTGTENYSFQLLKALAKIDTENRYLIYIKENSKFEIGNTKSWPENFKFQIINFKFLWTQIGLAFRTWIDPLDLLFISSHTLPVLKKPGLKTVLTVHDLGAEYLPSAHQLKQVIYLNLMTHYQLKSATKLIAVSEATKKDIVNRVGIAEKKIEVIYEGVDKKVFKPMSKDAVNNIVKTFDLEREKYFLFVGTIQPRKNLERLITAFSKFLSRRDSANEQESRDKNYVLRVKKNLKRESLNTNPLILIPKFKLVLVGQKGWKSEEIYKLPKELGIEDKVIFTGRIPDQDLVGLYNGALALTYPSLFEGFGLPIIEAFACGCPVITSDLSSMPEIGGDAVLLVDPYGVGSISNAMHQLSSDDRLRSTLIKKGRVRAGQFDWERCARETLAILKSR